MVTITFPDKSTRPFKAGVTGQQIADSISEGLGRAALAIEINGQLIDLTMPIHKDAKIRIITFKDEEGVEVFRHSCAHLLAHAVKRLFPYAKPTIGPVIEGGFYYDFDHRPFTPEDIKKIELEMKNICEEKIPIYRRELTKEDALRLFKDNEYKQELIKEQGDATLSIYEQGDFTDLCTGPHCGNTSKLKAVRLTKISGAYWRADAKNKQLCRVYGTGFPDKKQLKEHLAILEEAEKRDHRRIGRELDLLMFHEYSPGAPFFLPKGTAIYNELLSFIRSEYQKRGYTEVITPQMFNKKLWETSGHWEHFGDDMFTLSVEGQDFALKPMNCPSHLLMYKQKLHSYRDLPVRIADFCMLHRNELSGALGGLMRVRKFSQDDAHIFCSKDQIEEEVADVLSFIRHVWEEVFDFKLDYFLSTKPEKALGTKEEWDEAEEKLSRALDKAGITYETKKGDGAFYGPKIDIDLTDALGRKWQCPTCQLDFNLPRRFDAEYEGKDGRKHQVVMIHRAVLGSLERFLGIIIEHYAGRFPLWLSPVQVKVLSIADRHNDYVQDIAEKIKHAGLRAETDTRGESINRKVRDAQLEQANYIIVIGDKEREAKTVNVRTRANEILGAMPTDDFIAKAKEERDMKSLRSLLAPTKDS